MARKSKRQSEVINLCAWCGSPFDETHKVQECPRTPQQVSKEELARRYCSRQLAEPVELLDRLQGLEQQLQPTGWMLLECQVLDSSRIGSLVILPYGGKATYQEIPQQPISPRGLASDMSTVAAFTREES